MAPPLAPIIRGGNLEMTRDGMRLPERNAFEFTVRPQSQLIRGDRSKGGSGKDKITGKQKLQKSILNMKKKMKMSSSGNKFMAIVKYDG